MPATEEQNWEEEALGLGNNGVQLMPEHADWSGSYLWPTDPEMPVQAHPIIRWSGRPRSERHLPPDRHLRPGRKHVVIPCREVLYPPSPLQQVPSSVHSWPDIGSPARPSEWSGA